MSVVELKRGFVAWLLKSGSPEVLGALAETGYVAAFTFIHIGKSPFPVFEWGRHATIGEAQSRARFNLLVQSREVQAIKVADVITREQARLAAKYGKYLILPVNLFPVKKLVKLLDVVDPDYAMPSVEIVDIGDITNPVDLASMLEVLSGIEWVSIMRRGVEVLVELLVSRGVCVGSQW